MTRFPLPGQVPSPCISVCVMDPVNGLCTGCLRTLDEIGVWSVLDDEGKRAVWQRIASRRTAAATTSGTGINDES